MKEKNSIDHDVSEAVKTFSKVDFSLESKIKEKLKAKLITKLSERQKVRKISSFPIPVFALLGVAAIALVIVVPIRKAQKVNTGQTRLEGYFRTMRIGSSLEEIVKRNTGGIGFEMISAGDPKSLMLTIQGRKTLGPNGSRIVWETDNALYILETRKLKGGVL